MPTGDVVVPVICDEDSPQFAELTGRLAQIYRACADNSLIGIALRKVKDNREVAILVIPVDDGDGFIPVGEIYYPGYEPSTAEFVHTDRVNEPSSEATH